MTFVLAFILAVLAAASLFVGVIDIELATLLTGDAEP